MYLNLSWIDHEKMKVSELAMAEPLFPVPSGLDAVGFRYNWFPSPVDSISLISPESTLGPSMDTATA